MGLRRPTHADASAIFERYASDPEVTRYLAWPTHGSLDDTQAFLDFSDSCWSRWGCGPYLIELEGARRLLGSTGLLFEDRERVSTGYVLARDAWGLGYASEALQAMIVLAQQLGLRSLSAHVHVEHRISARVLEKAGFVIESEVSWDGHFPNLPPHLGHQQLSYRCSFI